MVDNSETGKHPYGYANDRFSNGDLWRSPSGKAPVRLITVLNKKKITKEAALEEAARLGLVIPDIEFKEKTKRRGRPKIKSAAVSDTDDDVENQQQVIKELVTKTKPKAEKQIKKIGFKIAKQAAHKAKKKAAPAKGEFKTPCVLLLSDGSPVVGLRVIEKKEGKKQYPVLRYMVHRKSGLAVKINEKNYTEEGKRRFAELFGSDGRKNVVLEEVEGNVGEKVVEKVGEKVGEKVEGNVGEKELEKVGEKVEGNVGEKELENVGEKELENVGENETDLSDLDLSDLEEEDFDDDLQEGEANSFDIDLNKFVNEDTGYFKTKTDDFIYNEDGDCIGEMIDGEFVAGEYE